VATAAAIVETIRAREAAHGTFDLVLFGNEAADTGDFQVGIRVAVALERPIVTGVKSLSLEAGSALARREATGGGWETYQVPLPAVVSVKEGLNLPRYPSVPGRLRAKRKEIERIAPAWSQVGPLKLGLRLPEEDGAQVEILGHGPEAAPAVVDLLVRIGVLPS
jgi:electron transfer flavoprotein beta subunit